MAEADEAALHTQGRRPRYEEADKQPAGCVQPVIAENALTPTSGLHEAGFRYMMDWCMEDQTCAQEPAAGTFFSVPILRSPRTALRVIVVTWVRRSSRQIVDSSRRAQRLRSADCNEVVLHSFIRGVEPFFRLRATAPGAAHMLKTEEPLWIPSRAPIASDFQTLRAPAA